MDPFRTKEFKSLHKAWMRKLEEDGFRDIEDTTSPREMLKTWDSHYFVNRFEPDTFQARAKYFQLATGLLETHQFTDELQRRVWELHARGFSLREIARMLKTETNHVNKDNVHAIVVTLQAVMGVG